MNRIFDMNRIEMRRLGPDSRIYPKLRYILNIVSKQLSIVMPRKDSYKQNNT